MIRIKFWLIVVLTVILSISGFSQDKKPWNKPIYDEYPYHFGFSLGLNTFGARIINSNEFFSLDTVYAIETKSQPGFSVLMVSSLRLGENFELRFTPGLIFGQRDLHYLHNLQPDTLILTKHIMRVESTYASFPLLLKYRSIRVNNYRPYLIAGINYTLDLESEKKIRDEERPKIRLSRNDLYFEAGIGLDYYLPYFKFATELKFSFGVMNLLRPDNTEYTRAIETINGRLFSILFYFE
ncbi:MAG TPA: outer membrane beta-barrel protein [Salinivirgaceae bacterium]|nr:outer membrane beta-barrel protein [Salinivirgaceae bacterium]